MHKHVLQNRTLNSNCIETKVDNSELCFLLLQKVVFIKINDGKQLTININENNNKLIINNLKHILTFYNLFIKQIELKEYTQLCKNKINKIDTINKTNKTNKTDLSENKINEDYKYNECNKRIKFRINSNNNNNIKNNNVNNIKLESFENYSIDLLELINFVPNNMIEYKQMIFDYLIKRKKKRLELRSFQR